MPKILFLLLALTLHSGILYKCPPPPPISDSEYYKDSCTYWHTAPLAYRLSVIPFKGAEKIEVVSFEDLRNYGIRKI